MVDFAGWEMPVQYAGIVAEHTAVRTEAGLFDVSHMGRLFVSGADAGAAIASVVSSEIEAMPVGRVRYGLVLADDGGVIDDVLVTRLAESRWLVVANASGRESVRPLLQQAADGRDAEVDDRTLELAMLAVQGPQAMTIVDDWFGETDRSSTLKYYRAKEAVTKDGLDILVSRTGYTGEDGVELVFDATHAVAVADRLIAEGVVPTGLGARDTLRLEAGMPLYGHELTLAINPLMAGLSFAVRSSGGFQGAAALADAAIARARVGIVFDGKRPVREGAPLFVDDELVGEVTSGTSSPTLGQPIAMGYVDEQYATLGQKVEAEVRGARIAGVVVDLPFYKRAK